MKLTAIGIGAAASLGLVSGTAVAGGVGPDVIVGDVTGASQSGGTGPQYYGSIGGIGAYSLGTTSCNVGTAELNWISSTNDHPVIGQNLFRIYDGRIEQLGLSWLKHGFFALQGTLCGPCIPSSSGGSRLGVGCSDPYSTGLNGSQSRLGPRSEVNASTGIYPYPFINRGDQGNTGDSIYKRIQVRNSDLDPANFPGAIVVSEAQYIAKDDSAAGNSANNSSYRISTIGAQQTDGGRRIHFAGNTQREQPAIQAWADHGLGVNQPDPAVSLTPIDIDNDGRFWVGSKVRDNGDGTYTYDYAIQNLTSDRSGGSFSVPVPAGVNVTDIDFSGALYHSGEPYDMTDWAAEVANGAITWSVVSTGNPDNDNALRWGTLYSFRFTADAPGTMAEAELGLFKPGFPGSASVSVDAPDLVACSPADVAADFGVLNIDDVIAFLDFYAEGDPTADLAAPTGVFNIDDVLAYVDAFAAGCP